MLSRSEHTQTHCDRGDTAGRQTVLIVPFNCVCAQGFWANVIETQCNAIDRCYRSSCTWTAKPINGTFGGLFFYFFLSISFYLSLSSCRQFRWDKDQWQRHCLLKLSFQYNMASIWTDHLNASCIMCQVTASQTDDQNDTLANWRWSVDLAIWC